MRGGGLEMFPHKTMEDVLHYCELPFLIALEAKESSMIRNYPINHELLT
jgi:hypothetical protein